jgi:glutaminase
MRPSAAGRLKPPATDGRIGSGEPDPTSGGARPKITPCLFYPVLLSQPSSYLCHKVRNMKQKPTGEAANRFFRQLDTEGQGKIPSEQLFYFLGRQGIQTDDPRLEQVVTGLRNNQPGEPMYRFLKPADLQGIMEECAVVHQAFERRLIVPDFEDFCRDLEQMFLETQKNTSGKVATYIPQLARVEPEQFAISVCTVDGQRFSLGNSRAYFNLQSTCKPVNYCLALQEHGEDKVHRHVGREPSGRTFNELSLNTSGLPHNPLINSGAIMCNALIQTGNSAADRFDFVFNTWRRLCATKSISFNNAVYLSERQTADRNFALAYFMRENKAFPERVDLTETLEFYFQCCSIESCTAHLATAAATLANAGVNPLTGEKIFDEQVVRHCLSLMLSCGMYDFSGEFAFRVGVPAKSGVSGALFLVIPNLMGISIWSPRLDHHGNSVRGVEFCERLVRQYNVHKYDSLIRETGKKNPRGR